MKVLLSLNDIEILSKSIMQKHIYKNSLVALAEMIKSGGKFNATDAMEIINTALESEKVNV